MTLTSVPPSLQEQLSQLFGSYKAEWLREQIFELFTEPAYFPELMTPRSCILIGGRGTGKTTVLRGLSYQGQFALSNQQRGAIRTWSQYGLYYRVNTNHVTAFDGPELSREQWIPLFGHYFNVLLCEAILEFLKWYELQTETIVTLDAHSCSQIAASLHLPTSSTHQELSAALADSKIGFEAYINNVVDAKRPLLSLQAAPVDLLCKAIVDIPAFAQKHFFFLLDEYENLLDYQQQVVNTFIKHSGTLYSFKIGVRELGWRCRSTLNDNEQLIHPADYARIDIAEKLQGSVFDEFALAVCRERISRIQVSSDVRLIRDLQVALPGLSDEEEAIRLGVEERAAQVRDELAPMCNPAELAVLDAMRPLERYFISFWAAAQSNTLREVLDEVLKDQSRWNTRYGNYKHAALYTIKQRKRGIRKYYAGWSVFTQLAAGNIRYVLELVDQSFAMHLQVDGSLEHPIPVEVQTKAAERVGSMNLSELEGLSVDGAQLTKLLLSLGRVFQVLATDPVGHGPEINQFHLIVAQNGAEERTLRDAERILNAAVMHLALLRSLGNKLGDVGDTKDYDYIVHPIYAALFTFSYRRKRKMLLAPETILGLIRKPKATIRLVLGAHNRGLPEEVPEQLTLFERFYHADA